MDIEKIKVRKRDGQLESYDPDKVSRVAQAAGARPIDADEISSSVTDWLESNGQEVVDSTSIRDQVFKELEKKDKYASGLFAWYQSLKDKKTVQND